MGAPPGWALSPRSSPPTRWAGGCSAFTAYSRSFGGRPTVATGSVPSSPKRSGLPSPEATACRACNRLGAGVAPPLPHHLGGGPAPRRFVKYASAGASDGFRRRNRCHLGTRPQSERPAQRTPPRSTRFARRLLRLALDRLCLRPGAGNAANARIHLGVGRDSSLKLRFSEQTGLHLLGDAVGRS